MFSNSVKPHFSPEQADSAVMLTSYSKLASWSCQIGPLGQ